MKPEASPKITPKIDAQPITVLGTEKETFERGFDPREYLKTYYPIPPDVAKILWASEIVKQGYSANPRMNIRSMVEKFNVSPEIAENIAIFDFQKAVSKKLLSAYPQDNIEVLDVGGGPTVYQHIAMSLQAGNITHSEFLEQNRKEVMSWLNNEEGAYNWDGYFDLIKTMFSNDQEYQQILAEQLKSEDEKTREHALLVKNLIDGNTENFKAHLRSELGQNVVHGDVFVPDLGLEKAKKYDVATQGREGAVEMLTSNFTIESATGDRAKWEQGMKNITAKIKNGGFLALTAIRNAEWYAVGKEKMPAVKVNEDDLKELLEREGFEIMEMRILEGSDQENVGYDGMVFVFAQKKG
jgi:hypothetical protein